MRIDSGKWWNLKFRFSRPGKSLKINQIVATFLTVYMFPAFIYIIIVYCWTWFGMGQLRCHQIQSNYNYLKWLIATESSCAGLTGNSNHNKRKWPAKSCKMHIKGPGLSRKTTSLFCMHPLLISLFTLHVFRCWNSKAEVLFLQWLLIKYMILLTFCTLEIGQWMVDAELWPKDSLNVQFDSFIWPNFGWSLVTFSIGFCAHVHDIRCGIK